MNEYLKKIVALEDNNDRFECFNVLLKHNIIDIKEIEDYYVDNVSEDTVLFAKWYYDYVNDKRLEDAVIKSRNAEYIYWFALEIKEANIPKLENAIIESESIISQGENARYICCFAKDIKGANITKLEDAIIESYNTQYIYWFARDVKGANISRLENIIIESKSAKYIYCFARAVKGANISKLKDAILKTRDIYYILLFAMDILKIEIKELNEELYIKCTFSDKEERQKSLEELKTFINNTNKIEDTPKKRVKSK